jgi:hypothetical protein
MWIDKQKTINLQLEMPVRLSTYRKGNAIPPLPGTNIFHSTELFHVFEMTRGYEPLLIVAYIGNRPVGKLLAVIRKSVRLFPPAIIKRCEIYGTGEYFDEEQNKEDLFGEISPTKYYANRSSSSSATWKIRYSDTKLSERTTISPLIG